jgi:hypothetical protein
MKREVGPSTTGVIWVIAVLAAVITSYQLTRPGFLFGITPDIAAWLGGSIRLVHGALPYRDFDLVQPPGFPLLATPLALLSEWIGTRDALALLRLCTPLLSAGSVLLMGKVVRAHGRVAVVVACGVMALYPAALYALRSGLLESVVAFFCLAGLAPSPYRSVACLRVASPSASPGPSRPRRSCPSSCWRCSPFRMFATDSFRS